MHILIRSKENVNFTLFLLKVKDLQCKNKEYLKILELK